MVFCGFSRPQLSFRCAAACQHSLGDDHASEPEPATSSTAQGFIYGVFQGGAPLERAT